MDSDEALELYRLLRTDPTRDVEELAGLRGVTPEAVRRDLQDLFEMGMIRTADGPPFDAAPERIALARHLEACEQHVARDSLRLASYRRDLEQLRHHHDDQLERHSYIVHHSSEQVRDRLSELARTATMECLSLNPGRIHRSEARAASKPLNQQALERGVTIHSIYQESFILDPETLDYGKWLNDLGGEVRMVPQVLHRLVLIDREIAILGVDKKYRVGHGVALEISSPSIVDVLLKYFTDQWDRAKQFTTRPRRSGPNIVDPLSKRLLELLASGATDEQAARTLGLSDRTVRRLMASLMKELGASSRLQAGVLAARNGWI